MEEVPDTDAGVARQDISLNPRSLIQGRCTSQASMIARDVRKIRDLFAYVAAGMPLDPEKGVPSPHDLRNGPVEVTQHTFPQVRRYIGAP